MKLNELVDLKWEQCMALAYFASIWSLTSFLETTDSSVMLTFSTDLLILKPCSTDAYLP